MAAQSDQVTRSLCEHVMSLRLNDVPTDVRDRAKHLLLDGVGCGLLAARLPWSELAVAVLADLEGDGRASVWGWDTRVPPQCAALVNGTFIQGFELDDY